MANPIHQIGRELGFDAVGIAPIVPNLGAERLLPWLQGEKHGTMAYMADNCHARLDPNFVLEGAQSIIVVARCYKTSLPAPTDVSQGKISRYAWGSDYHDVLRRDLKLFGKRLEEQWAPIRWRATVDSAPVMERDYARLAGLGWIGKNTLLLSRTLGSWFFLGALLVDRRLEADPSFATDHCGSCTRCLDACPTQAFDGPGELDARKCISYLTIELRGPIPDEHKPGLGPWIFGCDVCQDVCPWNRRAPTSSQVDFSPRPDNNPADLADLLTLSDEEFRKRFRGTPLFRTRRAGIVRNAAIAAGNQGATDLLPILEKLTSDEDPGVRDAALWAIDRLRL